MSLLELFLIIVLVSVMIYSGLWGAVVGGTLKKKVYDNEFVPIQNLRKTLIKTWLAVQVMTISLVAVFLVIRLMMEPPLWAGSNETAATIAYLSICVIVFPIIGTLFSMASLIVQNQRNRQNAR